MRISDWSSDVCSSDLFWCPLLAVFTGMRREEICQLKATDFDEHGGIWFVRVQATEGRSLKTPAAERDIPIHEELIRIGLRTFGAPRSPRWLFPEARKSVGQGKGVSVREDRGGP